MGSLCGNIVFGHVEGGQGIEKTREWLCRTQVIHQEKEVSVLTLTLPSPYVGMGGSLTVTVA